MARLPHSRQNQEVGAVLMLLALTVLVIFGMIALALDTSIITTSRAHLRIAAELAVRGALEQYGIELSKQNPATQEPTTPREALTSAIARAQASVRQNFNYNPGNKFQAILGSAQDDIREACDPLEGNGCLRPIMWYFPDSNPLCPADATTRATADPLWRPCACDQGCECAEGCAKDPVALGVAGNGLRLTYRTAKTSPIRGFFRSVVRRVQGLPKASEEVSFGVTTRAVLVPRNTVFAIDLSPSIASLPAAKYNMNKWAKPVPRAPTDCKPGIMSYVYDLEPSATCTASSNVEPQNLMPIGTHQPGTSPLLPAKGNEGEYSLCVYRGYPTDLPGSGNAVAEFNQCVNFDATDPIRNADGTNETRSYLLNGVTAPEPLTSVLRAVNQTLTDFELRSVPGDRVGIIGLDHERVLNRILAESKNNLALMQGSLLNTVEWEAFKNATNPDIPITDRRRWSKFLFPRNTTKNEDAVYTDLPQLLQLSRRMIMNNPNYARMQNFVVLFTDGMTNCKASGPNRCNASDETYFNDSLDLTLAEIETGYVPQKITLHTILFGETSLPHDLAWRIDNRCATAEEARSMGLPLTDLTGSFSPIGSPRVAKIFQQSSKTGGIWGPIRDCYRRTASSGCSTLESTFPNACRNINNNARVTTLGSNIVSNTVVGGPDLPGLPPEFFDNRGRLIRDPLGRSVSQQMQDYVNIILAKPPYVFATPSCRQSSNAFEDPTLPCCNGKTTQSCS